MAVESYPFGISAETYSAEITRRTIESVLQRATSASVGTVVGGILGSGADLQMTAPGSGLSVNVSAGECVVPGSALYASTPSGYYLHNTASLNVTGFTANGSNPTIYLVCATINDATYQCWELVKLLTLCIQQPRLDISCDSGDCGTTPVGGSSSQRSIIGSGSSLGR